MKEEYKYCWLNIVTGEFSNCWTDSDTDSHEMKVIISNNTVEWKLIKFQCLTDKNFVFTKHMRLK